MSFASDAAFVRDARLPLAQRVMGLKHCVARFKPLGYRATMAHLEAVTGSDRAGWNGERLEEAIDLLEITRRRWLVYDLGWANERRRRKAAGERDVSSEELDERQAKPWLDWPRAQADKSVVTADAGMVEPTPFRPAQRADFDVVMSRLPKARSAWHRPFEVQVYEDRLSIPGRIYNPEPDLSLDELSDTQQTMLHCLYTRHGDGHIRQRHLASVLAVVEPWVAPYVVALIGEYVVEIIDDVRVALTQLDEAGSQQQIAYGRFVLENRKFMALTASRVASYWSEYYRHSHGRPSPTRASGGARPVYPGFELLERLNAAARQRGW